MSSGNSLNDGVQASRQSAHEETVFHAFANALAGLDYIVLNGVPLVDESFETLPKLQRALLAIVAESHELFEDGEAGTPGFLLEGVLDLRPEIVGVVLQEGAGSGFLLLSLD